MDRNLSKSSVAPHSGHRVQRAAPTAAFSIILLVAASVVHADDFIVYSPHVVTSQSEIELRGYRYDDARTDLGGASAAELSISHAFTSWWKPELYLAMYQKVPGSGGGLIGYEFENTFQFTQPGEYWADFGFLAAYEHKTLAHNSDAIEFGPLIEKTVGRFTHTANFIWEKQVGAGTGGKYEFRYSYSGTYAVSNAFRPGLEAYGRAADRAYQAGPIVAGEWHLPGTTSNFEYRVGVVFGLNATAPRQTWLAQLEYEFL
jgi:hypothetical protein